MLWSPAKWWIKMVLFIVGPVTSCSSLSRLLSLALFFSSTFCLALSRIIYVAVEHLSPRVFIHNFYANDLWLCEHKCCFSWMERSIHQQSGSLKTLYFPLLRINIQVNANTFSYAAILAQFFTTFFSDRSVFWCRHNMKN